MADHTNAARQARYRQARRTGDRLDEERLDIMLALPARLALKRLARHYGLTRKAALEKVLAEHQDAVLDTTADAGAHYYRDFEPPPAATR